MIIKKAIIFVNPGASTVETKAKDSAQQLRELGFKSEIIEASPDEFHAKLLQLKPEGSSLWTVGGDGTVNKMFSILMQDDVRARGWHKQLYIPLPGGNANDVATMLTAGASASEILEQGHIQEVYPLKITVTEPSGKTKTYFAAGYSSLGSTANASRQMEAVKNPEQPAARLVAQSIRELFAGWMSVAKAPTFRYRPETGKARQLTDILFVNGDRMAKYGRFEADIDRGEYERLLTGPLGVWSSIGHMLRFTRNDLPSQTFSRQNPAPDFTITSTKTPKIALMFDGETAKIASGSRVSVRLAPDSVRTLMTTAKTTSEPSE